MEFPVDTLASVRHGQLERSGHAYMDALLHGNPDHAHSFLLPNGRKVQIGLSSVGFVPLYGGSLENKVLALFAPEDLLTAVALLLSDQWYAVENILRTANPAREGLIQVTSVVERIVLYVLNRIVYRTNEMAAGDVPFLCHNKNDYAKILWKGGEAVGFYSIKTKGSCTQFYHLPVMNSMFVRKGHRGNGHGLQMLEDFVDSFNEAELGLKYPLSPAVSRVCQRYLAKYPADVDLLWEVEGMGGPYQRTQLASRLSAHTLSDGRYHDDHKNRATAQAAVGRLDETAPYITEEAIVVNKQLTLAEEVDKPISTRTRSSEHRWRKRGREEPVDGAAESQPQKISRGAEPCPEPVEAPTAVISATQHEEDIEASPPPAGGMVEASMTSEATAAEQKAKEPVMEVMEVMEVNGSVEEESLVPGKDEEVRPFLQNGTAREEEEDVEGEEEYESVVKEAVASVGKWKEEGAEKQEEEVAEETQEEETSAGVEEGQEQEVTPASENVSIAANAEKDEAPRATEEEREEEEWEEEAAAEEVELVPEEEPSPEAVTPDTASLEETAAPEDEEPSAVGQGGAADASERLPDAVAPDVRVLRGGRSKAVPLRPKHSPRKPGKAAAQDAEGERLEEEEEDEERGPSTEDEKATTEEEHSSEEDEEEGPEAGPEEEPQVVDMRVLRRKTRVYQTTPQHRAKRRSKM